MTKVASDRRPAQCAVKVKAGTTLPSPHKQSASGYAYGLFGAACKSLLLLVQRLPSTVRIGDTVSVVMPSSSPTPSPGDRVLVATFDDCEAAYATVERLRRERFTDEQVQFAMRGERPPRGICRLGDSPDRAAASSVGSFIGVLVGGALGAAAAWLLDPIDSWAAPAGALVGLTVGSLLAQLTHRVPESEWSATAGSAGVQGALREGRAVVAVLAEGRVEEVARLLDPDGARKIGDQPG